MAQRKLGFEIHTVDLLLKRTAESCEVIRRSDTLTGTHGHILGYLAAHSDQEIFQRDIERDFSIRRSSASQVLQLMERNGLIERLSVDRDARLKKICMTPKGKELHQATITVLEEIGDKALEGVDPDKVDAFYQVMDAIKRNLGWQEKCQCKRK